MAPTMDIALSSAKQVPLLLTSSVVAHDIAVRLRDTNARLHHALESIGQWLRIDPSLQIVLCDGSNFNLATEVSRRFPTAKIECLAFENNQALVKELGRGWGEGEIVKYALRHSQLIQTAGCFAKCTSKLWVENYKECMRHWNGQLLLSGVFLNTLSPFTKTIFKQIDTRFYVADVKIYEKYFLDAHISMDSRAGHGLEDSFFDILKQHEFSKCLIPIPPVIQGVGGGTGKYYSSLTSRQLKEKLRLSIVRRRYKFKRLFCN